MTHTFTKCKKYAATIILPGFKAIVPNSTVEDKLKAAGFTNVFVSGSGKERKATGIWTGETQAVSNLPKEITEIVEL